MSELQLVLGRNGDEVHRGPGAIQQLLRRVRASRAAERRDIDRVLDCELHPGRHRAEQQHAVDLLDQICRVIGVRRQLAIIDLRAGRVLDRCVGVRPADDVGRRQCGRRTPCAERQAVHEVGAREIRRRIEDPELRARKGRSRNHIIGRIVVEHRWRRVDVLVHVGRLQQRIHAIARRGHRPQHVRHQKHRLLQLAELRGHRIPWRQRLGIEQNRLDDGFHIAGRANGRSARAGRGVCRVLVGAACELR